MSETTLVITGVVAIAAIFGYLWFRRMRLSASDTYDPNPADEGNNKK